MAATLTARVHKLGRRTVSSVSMYTSSFDRMAAHIIELELIEERGRLIVIHECISARARRTSTEKECAPKSALSRSERNRR